MTKKIALVTGSARRIGAAIIRSLHQAGFDVVIHYLTSKDSALKLYNELNNLRPNSALLIQHDLSKLKPESLIAEILNWQGRLDVLVNSASLFLRSTNEFDLKSWQEQFMLNVQVPFMLSLAAYPLLAKQKGVIINITDIHAETPIKDYAVYCQTKAALEMQTKALAKEFAPLVRVNAVAPGAISWPEGESELKAETKQKIIQETPLKCHGSPSYIAKAVRSLIENEFITGQVLKVDGGRSI